VHFPTSLTVVPYCLCDQYAKGGAAIKHVNAGLDFCNLSGQPTLGSNQTVSVPRASTHHVQPSSWSCTWSGPTAYVL